MLDMRYHIASLVAVFLALALGILLGTVFVDERVLVQKQNQLVEGIRTDVEKVRDENKQLDSQKKLSDEFERAVLPLVVQKKLEGRQTMVIASVPVEQSVKTALQNALTMAGAKVYFIKATSATFGLERKEIEQRLTAFFPEDNLKKDQLKEKIIKQLALSLASTDSTFLNELTGLKLLEVEGQMTLPANEVIIFGGTEDKTFLNLVQNDIALGNQLRSLGLPVVGVEVSDATVTSIPLFKKSGLSTIDNVDTVWGQLALVLVLEGRQGNFGTKSTAQSLLPKAEVGN